MRVRYRATLFYMYFDVFFTRISEAGLQETEARFYIPVQTLTDFDFLNLTDLVACVDSKIESFNTNGSGWELDHIISATLATCCYRPAQGSSYIETPECLAKKKAVINVQNTKDELCFAWAVLSAIHPPKKHPERISKYKQYLGELNLTGLSFPLKVRDVLKFEKLNPHISVNVNAFEMEQQIPELIPLYISPDRQRKHHVNLLLLTDKTGRQHYVYIKSLSKLVCGRTSHDGQTHV